MTPTLQTKRAAGAAGETPRNVGQLLLALLVLAALAERASLAARWFPDALFDDAYITFRYAANLARGFGFVYNPGERIWGTTTPLFTLLLAGLARLFHTERIEMVAVVIGIVASLGTLVLTARVLDLVGVRPPLKWLYLVCTAFLPSFVANSVSGMETAVVLFWMVLTLFYYVRQRFFPLALAGGLLLLTRIDGGIWLAVVAAHLLLERRLKDLGTMARSVAIFSLAVLPWFVFAEIYFGNVIPQSVVGKAVSHGSFQGLDANYFLSYLSSYFPGAKFGHAGWIVLPAGLAITLLGIVNLWRQYPLLRPLCSFWVFYNCLFLFARAPMFSWYFQPGLWAFYLPVLCGVGVLVAWLRRPLHVTVNERWIFAGLGLLVVSFGVWRLRLFQAGPSARSTWSEVSILLEQRTQPAARVFLEHIGLVGYRTNRYIYDSMGLVTPETVRLKRSYGELWLPKAARRYRADVVLIYGQDLLRFEDPANEDAQWFWKSYSRAAEFNSSEPAVTVFFLKDSPQIVEAQPPRASLQD